MHDKLGSHESLLTFKVSRPPQGHMVDNLWPLRHGQISSYVCSGLEDK